ncbi:MAG: ribosome biogenesis GTP-binding protein YihA/YsxC [Saprospiraceae bacterium]|nr:ribosome biogenesis GTP-binding protein YihA/YsxC [Saprospiraceae bacterium]
MEVQTAFFVGSFPTVTKCPTDQKPEYAFIGRSNVGKSSLINLLTNRNELARTSQKPGKTQSLNFYVINDGWYIVDLPGYGYAKISKTKRKEWERMIHGYLQRREWLQTAFVLIDANIEPQDIDIEFINWMGDARIPFSIIFTKADKSKPNEIDANIEAFQKKLMENWEELPPQFVTSARNKEGAEAILQYIDEINQRSEQFY